MIVEASFLGTVRFVCCGSVTEAPVTGRGFVCPSCGGAYRLWASTRPGASEAVGSVMVKAGTVLAGLRSKAMVPRDMAFRVSRGHESLFAAMAEPIPTGSAVVVVKASSRFGNTVRSLLMVAPPGSWDLVEGQGDENTVFGPPGSETMGPIGLADPVEPVTQVASANREASVTEPKPATGSVRRRRES
jgi:hypothetical protein